MEELLIIRKSLSGAIIPNADPCGSCKNDRSVTGSLTICLTCSGFKKYCIK